MPNPHSALKAPVCSPLRGEMCEGVAALQSLDWIESSRQQLNIARRRNL